MYRSVSIVGSRIGIVAQLGLVASTLAFVSLSPPAQGAILLVPLTAHAAEQVARLAVDGDALLLAQGPLPGSLVVRGARARLAARMLNAAILPIAADTLGCGDGAPADG